MSAPATSASATAVPRAPPQRVTSSPPANDPTPHNASNGAAAAVVPCNALAAAVTATSSAPSSTPTPTGAPASASASRACAAILRGSPLGHQRRPPARVTRTAVAKAAVTTSRTSAPAARAHAGRPQHAEAEHERRPAHPGQLDGRGLERVGDTDGARDRSRAPGAGCAGTRPPAVSPARFRPQARPGRPAGRASGSSAIAQSSAPPTAGARQQHDRLSPAVDEPTEHRTADADRHRVDAGDDAGCGEGASQPLDVDHQPDAEHRQRKPREDRRAEQAPCAGG